MKQTAIGITVLLAIGAAIVAARTIPWANAPSLDEIEPTGTLRVTSTGPADEETLPMPDSPLRRTALVQMTPERVDELIARGFVPAKYRTLWLDPDYDEIAERRFNVIPKTRREPGEVCEPLGVEGSQLCWNDYGYHPYLAYELEQLKSMADMDAAAAEAVAMRLPANNEDERLHFVMLASRLSGKAGPIMRHVYRNEPRAQDPQYFEKSLDRFSLALFGERMGYPYRFSVELEAKLRNDFNLTRDQLREALDRRRSALYEAWRGES